MELIDTHQHLFYRDQLSYPWLADFKSLDDDFVLDRYVHEAGTVKPTGTVFMECDVAGEQIADEARLVYTLAKTAPIPILGVIAAARPEENGFGDHLDSIDHSLLVGVRRVLHVAPDGTAEAPLFIPNLKQLAKRDLTFDLCVRPDQLGLAAGLAKAVPELQFILDHCGCPNLNGSSDPIWRDGIAALAALPNVACKVSGLTAYGNAEDVTLENLYRTLDTVFEQFGADRLVWGGDWPVCTLNSTLAGWIAFTIQWAEKLSEPERIALFGGNAREVYGLGDSA
jgi:predicted TIM-barrel fold metal-dependent hydrolase